ncbi:MAG: class I SAM-dependent methyltransferase [Spirochaetales bacterium]|nr:class I SAM-dependent methyltransferase [Spirochaetales bacterium]
MTNMEEKSWWQEDWFWDAYRPLMFDPDRMEDTPLEVDRILALTGLKAGDRFLDSCCGFGRHALEMARRGIIVTGVDRQEDYILEAKDAARKEGLDAAFVNQNTLSYRNPGAFDGAMNFFTSFGYFEDEEEEEQAVRNVYDSLKPGGFFLIDIQGKELLARNFKERDWFERNGYKIFLEYKIVDAWTKLENRWMFIPMGGGKLTEISFTHRIYSALELASLLGRCGFEEVELYGSLLGTPYDDKAERLIAVGRK